MPAQSPAGGATSPLGSTSGNSAVPAVKPRVRESRFNEPQKFLPMIFVLSIIVGLYLVYVFFHIPQLLQRDVEPKLRDVEAEHRGWNELVIFHCITAFVMICYTRSVYTNPGEVPSGPEWIYQPLLSDYDPAPQIGVQAELKRTGERRHCKWCGRFKPDRCHHCRVCRVCVLRMDHHCPWIYNCVGFCNHKYFFLLLLYSCVDCIFIVVTMMETMQVCTEEDTPLLHMYLVLFGMTLAGFMGFLITLFFSFHIWLMLKAMTTIEFCEKSLKRSAYDGSIYNEGTYQNICAVLGPHPLLWLLPLAPPRGDGLSFVTETSKLLPKKRTSGDAPPATERGRRRGD